MTLLSPRMRERLASPLTWHIVGFGVLLVVAVGLAVRLGFDWSAMDTNAQQVLSNKRAELKLDTARNRPLDHIDTRVEKTRKQVADFYQKRIPPNYSSIDARINELQVASGVRLTRVQYTQGEQGPGLTEITMDASISGEYSAIMKFVNSIERDPMFFIVRAMALTSQQGGLVNLRLRVSTWLRPADAAASGLPPTQPENPVQDDRAPTAPPPAPGNKEGE